MLKALMRKKKAKTIDDFADCKSAGFISPLHLCVLSFMSNLYEIV